MIEFLSIKFWISFSNKIRPRPNLVYPPGICTGPKKGIGIIWGINRSQKFVFRPVEIFITSIEIVSFKRRFILAVNSKSDEEAAAPGEGKPEDKKTGKIFAEGATPTIP